MENLKLCPECNTEKSKDEFVDLKGNKNPRGKYCKSCYDKNNPQKEKSFTTPPTSSSLLEKNMREAFKTSQVFEDRFKPSQIEKHIQESFKASQLFEGINNLSQTVQQLYSIPSQLEKHIQESFKASQLFEGINNLSQTVQQLYNIPSQLEKHIQESFKASQLFEGINNLSQTIGNVFKSSNQIGELFQEIAQSPQFKKGISNLEKVLETYKPKILEENLHETLSLEEELTVEHWRPSKTHPGTLEPVFTNESLRINDDGSISVGGTRIDSQSINDSVQIIITNIFQDNTQQIEKTLSKYPKIFQEFLIFLIQTIIFPLFVLFYFDHSIKKDFNPLDKGIEFVQEIINPNSQSTKTEVVKNFKGIKKPLKYKSHICFVTKDNIYIFKKTNTKSEKLKIIFRGESLHVIGAISKWIHVEYIEKDKIINGWVLKKYTSKKGKKW